MTIVQSLGVCKDVSPTSYMPYYMTKKIQTQ